MSVSICIGGDLGPTESNRGYFENGDIENLVGPELLHCLANADFRVFNLEMPLTDELDPISKWGPNLHAPLATVIGIKALNPSCLGLANNHILDQGEQGLLSTITVLDENNIAHVGAGKNLAVAQAPLILTKDMKKIGIYACAEHEFSIATPINAGANPFDPLESLDHIHMLKRQCDYLVVLYHGGKEHYRYPSPYLQKVCRKICDKGADMVVCQHSHCIGCEEKYHRSTIVYGQGNFIFDRSDNVYRDTSLIIRIELNEANLKIEYVPVVKNKNTIAKADPKQSDEILNAFYERSSQILQPDFVDKHYQEYARDRFNKYINVLIGDSLFMRVLKKLLRDKLPRNLYSQQSWLGWENYIMAEAHRELLETGLRLQNSNTSKKPI